MNIQIAVLCDAATESGGKMNLLGTFDTIYTPHKPTTEQPAVHLQCSIALRMTFNNVEEGVHNLRLNFVDEDGKFLMPSIPKTIEVVVPPDTHFATYNFIVTIQQLKFEKPGLYSIDIALDGRQEASIPLMVKHMEAPRPAVD
jgi:hypothetical protein